MKLIEIVKMICVNLVQNKYKVLLTSLGIIIGTITITLVIAIGQGGEKQISDQFKNMSVETIYVNYTFAGSNTNQEVLDEDTIKSIKEENPYIDNFYIRTLFPSEVFFGNKKTSTLSIAVTQGYTEVSNYRILEGNDFSEQDYSDGTRVAVIGSNMAKQYYNAAEEAINKEITIGKQRFKIIGVLDETNDSLQGVSPDESIFIPYFTAEKHNLLKEDQIPQGVALAKDKKLIDKAMKRIRSTLDYVFENGESYAVEDAGSRIDAAMESATTMKFLLVSVATIVFIVSGIGIMNVLFVSVKERTREIGVLKAIGTSQKDILLLFLLESVGIGLLGGIIGEIISFILLSVLQGSSIPIHPTVSGKLVALLFAIITSTVFGFYPAYKASKMKPIDALNQE